MQTYSQTGVSGDTELTSTQLGYDPDDYTHHTVACFSLGGDTFSVLARLPGSSSYASIGISGKADGTMVSVGPEYPLDGIKIAFAGGSISAGIIAVASFTLQASIRL